VMAAARKLASTARAVAAVRRSVSRCGRNSRRGGARTGSGGIGRSRLPFPSHHPALHDPGGHHVTLTHAPPHPHLQPAAHPGCPPQGSRRSEAARRCSNAPKRSVLLNSLWIAHAHVKELQAIRRMLDLVPTRAEVAAEGWVRRSNNPETGTQGRAVKRPLPRAAPGENGNSRFDLNRWRFSRLSPRERSREGSLPTRAAPRSRYDHHVRPFIRKAAPRIQQHRWLCGHVRPLRLPSTCHSRSGGMTSPGPAGSESVQEALARLHTAAARLRADAAVLVHVRVAGALGTTNLARLCASLLSPLKMFEAGNSIMGEAGWRRRLSSQQGNLFGAVRSSCWLFRTWPRTGYGVPVK
jgi:hypothetical protein